MHLVGCSVVPLFSACIILVLKIRPTSVKVDLACKANGYGQMSSINRLEGDERLLYALSN